MARNGLWVRCGTGRLSELAPFVFPVGVASTASPPSLLGYLRVLFCEFVAFCAMRFRLLFRSARHSAKGEAGCKYSPARIKNLRKAQPLGRSLNDGVNFEAAQVGKLDGLIGSAFYYSYSRYPLIALLLALCRPFAIAWFVISVIVDALNGVLRWALSHIGNKAFKGQPSIANGNPASAVILPRYVRWIVAPAENSSPNIVERVVRWGAHFLLLLNSYMQSLAWLEMEKGA